jgi:hypothetical protein
MAFQDLHALLVAASKHPSLRTTLKKGGKEAEALMTEAGLSAQEAALVKSGDKEKIKKYLGDRYAAASKVNVWD